jgi:alkanesulfonate monooxygenase SsuD/methylene tetrahydromethanopterin reductase-like flavin-dependent oxidoreductase (luciferase family)
VRDPLGQFINDNLMMTNGVMCFEDRKKARRLALDRVNSYIVTMVNLYHDTMPKSPDAITWPNAPILLKDRIGGGDPDEFLDELIRGGFMLCGNPEEVSEQLSAYESVGCDQLVFGLPQDLYPDEVVELLELFGDKVIPEHDKDRVHSTDRYRSNAVPKYGPFSRPLPEAEWPTIIPVTAR